MNDECENPIEPLANALSPSMEAAIEDGLITLDGKPLEVLPDFWALTGFIGYDGHVLLAAFDSVEERTLFP